MRTKALILALALSASAGLAFADTRSDYDRDYDLAKLKTFDFKHQSRSVRDPLGANQLWSRRIHDAIVKDLTAKGYEAAGSSRPDFVVAYYMGTRQREDVRYLGYGLPVRWGWRRWGWTGWGDADVWRTPYTQSTLVVDVIDARSNLLVWRGYDTENDDLSKADKTIPKAVDHLVERFVKEAADLNDERRSR